MKNNLIYKVNDVRYNETNSKILTIDVDNIGVNSEYNVYEHCSGGFGSIWLRDIPLDEVIKLRDKLTEVINKEVEKLNESLIETKVQETTKELEVESKRSY